MKINKGDRGKKKYNRYTRAVRGSVDKALARGYTAVPEIPGSIHDPVENFRRFFSASFRPPMRILI